MTLLTRKRSRSLGRLTSAEAAELYAVSVEQFLVWWMRGEVPFRRITEDGHAYFVLHDPDGEAAWPSQKSQLLARERLNESLRSFRAEPSTD